MVLFLGSCNRGLNLVTKSQCILNMSFMPRIDVRCARESGDNSRFVGP